MYLFSSQKVFCGHWDETARKYHPNGCIYHDVTLENANKCLKGRTLAFIGDSNVRDLGVGLLYFLNGYTEFNSSDQKFDRHYLDPDATNLVKKWISFIPPMKMWNKTGVECDGAKKWSLPGTTITNYNMGKDNGFLHTTAAGVQVQIWSMFNARLMKNNLEES